MQLTYPPMIAFFPYINPDGSKISFTTQYRQISVIDINGGQPQLTTGKDFVGGNWSPDGTHGDYRANYCQARGREEFVRVCS